MSASEADSTEESGPGGIATSGGSSSQQTAPWTRIIYFLGVAVSSTGCQVYSFCFCMGRPIVQEFDECIHVAEATTVDTFALDVTMYFAKLPYFWTALDDECTYV